MKKSKILILTVIIAVFISGCASSKKDVTRPYGLNPELTEVVNTNNGPIQGIKSPDSDVELFAGIPFAKPPVADLRWREPQDVDNWDGIYLADHFEKMAMQNRHSAIYNFAFNFYTHSQGSRTQKGEMSEDCLYLNIWRPENVKPEEKLPVLVYIHGGSLMSGQSWFESYDGEGLAKKGIIVVTIAYRTGVFGYYAHPDLAAESPNNTTGNYGLLDQIKALEWINNNIECFGGDAANITIAGESAGSSSVNALCASPLTKGMFRRAIGESSSLVVQTPAHSFRSQEDAYKMGKNILKEMNCSTVEELRALPAEKVLSTSYLNNCMTVDSYAMPEYPWEIYSKGLNHEEALLNGFNDQEGFVFTVFSNITKKNLQQLLSQSPYCTDAKAVAELKHLKNNKEAKKFYTDFFSVVCFTYPHTSWTKMVTNQGKPVYEYYFSKTNKSISTNHSGELIYAYNNVPRTSAYKQSDYELQEIMSDYWVNFVKYGNPNGGNLPLWQTYGESDGMLMELGGQVYMRRDPFEIYYPYVNFDIDHQKRPPTFGTTEDRK